MNEYASRFSYLAQIETMENETLLRLYISSIIGLLVGLYNLFNYQTPDEKEIINDLFTIMNIIRIACLLLSIIALINFMTTTYDDSEDERNVDMLVNYAGRTFMENLLEGLLVWFFFTK